MEGFQALAVSMAAAPWMTQIRGLRWHFKLPQLDLAKIFNGISSVLALALFGFYAWADPETSFHFSRWWLPLLLAAVAAGSYFTLFLLCRRRVEAGSLWPVVVGSVLYAGMFCLFTSAFGEIAILQSRAIVEGAVFAAGAERRPIADAIVELESPEGEVLGSARSDDRGRFRTLLPKKKFGPDSICRVVVVKEGYEDAEVPFSSPLTVALTPDAVDPSHATDATDPASRLAGSGPGRMP